MEHLRWWLLLLSAVMFSMSGCASRQEWADWLSHPTHFASGAHMGFSALNDDDGVPIVRDSDLEQAQRQDWWGQRVPAQPPVDLNGRWTGTWIAAGLWGGQRESLASATVVQEGHYGVARIALQDASGSGVPWAFRRAGGHGIEFYVAVAGSEARLRDRHGEVKLLFRLVGDRLYGIVPDDPRAVAITLVRQSG